MTRLRTIANLVGDFGDNRSGAAVAMVMSETGMTQETARRYVELRCKAKGALFRATAVEREAKVVAICGKRAGPVARALAEIAA